MAVRRKCCLGWAFEMLPDEMQLLFGHEGSRAMGELGSDSDSGLYASKCSWGKVTMLGVSSLVV